MIESRRYPRAAEDLRSIEAAASAVLEITESFAEGSCEDSARSLQRLKWELEEGGFDGPAKALARYGWGLWYQVSPARLVGSQAPVSRVAAARRRVVRAAHKQGAQDEADRARWACLRTLYRSAFVISGAAARFSPGDGWANEAVVHCVSDELTDLWDCDEDSEDRPIREICLSLLPEPERATDPMAWLAPGEAGHAHGPGSSTPARQLADGAIRDSAVGPPPASEGPELALRWLGETASDVLGAIDALAADRDCRVGEQLVRLHQSACAVLACDPCGSVRVSLGCLRRTAEEQRAVESNEDTVALSPWRRARWNEERWAWADRATAAMLAPFDERTQKRLRRRGVCSDLHDLHEIAVRVHRAAPVLRSTDVWTRSTALLDIWAEISFDLPFHRRSMRRYLDQLIEGARQDG